MSLNLNKPLVYFDIEATGLSITSDRIVEIAFLKVDTDNTETTRTWRVNPEATISDEAYKIHKISQAEAETYPPFRDIAGEVAQLIGNGDLAGFNLLKFDLPLLMEEFMRAEVDFDLSKRKVVDVQRIFHLMEKRTLEAAYRFYCNKDLSKAHSAEADTLATHEVLKAQIERYDDLENDIKFLNDFIGDPKSHYVDLAGRLAYNKKKEPVFNFGKYKGKPVKEILKQDPSYYNWMMQGDFPEYTKRKMTELRLQMKQEETGS
jgi:DNA polymerase-3 subunit epsilon